MNRNGQFLIHDRFQNLKKKSALLIARVFAFEGMHKYHVDKSFEVYFNTMM